MRINYRHKTNKPPTSIGGLSFKERQKIAVCISVADALSVFSTMLFSLFFGINANAALEIEQPDAILDYVSTTFGPRAAISGR